MNIKQYMGFKRLWSLLLTVTLIAAYLPFGQQKAEAADLAPAGSDKVVITPVTSAEGFTHPGIGLTKEILENARTQVIAKQEPWYSYYVTMSQSGYAASTFSANIFGSANGDGTDNPKKRNVNGKGEFVADGLRAYTQALMYYFTGEESYRSNAMRIIRLWSQMDPAQYSYFTDSHIHMGIPLNRMVTAAEILRYTGAEGENPNWTWTEADTVQFTENLIKPMIATYCYFNDKFMNQHLYPLIGAVSGYIFMNNPERYAEGVEWLTVNRTAPDQGQNGSIKRLFRLVTHNENTGEPLEAPRVQHVEMGRDQAHGAGDLTNVEILARLLEAQGTKVDPELGTISTSGNAVTAYAFLGNRVLAASDYFARFMLGHDTPWTPVIARYDNGVPIVYQILSGNYRGRIGGNVYGQYYYYKYNLGLDLEKEAPYYADMFKKRHMFWWESPDGGADYWLFIPQAAAQEGTSTLPKVSSGGLQEMEYRTATDLNGQKHASTAVDEDGVSYVRIQATEEGSSVSLVASGTALKTVALKFRTNGTARLEMNGWKDNGLVLPDTNGQWQYAVLSMNDLQSLGDLIYLKATGNGTLVDVDHILLDAAAQLTPPVFAAGKSDLNLYAYAGSQAILSYDFSAVDVGVGERVGYQMDNKPEGALFDETTGAFSWKPEQPGSYSLVVSAGDGTSIMARSVSITVANDRQGAVIAAIAPYKPEAHYISATLEPFQAEYAKSLQMLPTAADEEFYSQLSKLNSAVQGLRLLTPLMDDGSMDYVNMGVTSTFGTQIASLVDNAPDSFAGYYLTGDRSFIIDFGADFKVSADAVKLQVRAGFPERIGGAALYGSNDRENWTRLTPGRTVAADDMQELQVSAELRQNQYRFLRLHMNDEPTSTMFELSELRIIGTRHETHNKLASVFVSSPQAVQGRVSTGNTVSVSFTSNEPITDVQVAIQGQQAAVISPDQRTWTAFVAMDSTMAMGKIRFTIDYKTATGISADTVMFTTDNSSLYYINRSGFLDVSKLASVTASSAGYGSGGLPADKVGSLLFDGNTATFGDLASGTDAYYTVDFGEGASVRLNGV
ncbi:MAG: coagulation factor 5/8 type domain protein, partial [Paenibacillaceae bacterium]|nr:coagulation factor 5/8 type domain protein [Paenibacillaceae bacterium]